MTTGVYEIAPEEDLLYSLSADGRRKFIHPLIQRGRFWLIRRNIAYFLFALFFGLPIVRIGGHPAVLIDLETRQTHLFGAAFHPTDTLVLATFGFGVVVTVFFVSSTFGRIWCGFGCPQTVYLEFVFRPIETFLEGAGARIDRFNAAPWTARKVAVKAAKWGLWTAIAMLMALNFVSYFTGWGPLLHGVTTQPSAWMGALFTTAFLTAAIVFDFSWFRDQMCTITCPYGRLQNVIADQDTVVVAYDRARSEPRMQPKKRAEVGIGGDCIDCGRCVAVCPTGTDIRRGLQVECIGTGLCVDACDDVMRKLGKPIGLIRYTSEREQRGGTRQIWRPRNFAYLALMVASWGTFAILVCTRADALVEFVRGGREPYRVLSTGEVANQQRIRITNRLDEPQRFTIEVVDPQQASLVVSDSPIVVEPAGVAMVNAVTTTPRTVFSDGQATVRYLVQSDRGFSKEYRFLLLGPFGPGGRP